MEEIWKRIEDCDYEYEISNHGNFRNINSFFKKNKGNNFKQSLDSKGYLRVGIVCNKKIKIVKTHRLVAKYFLCDYNEHLTVNHKDFNKQNNNVSNLEMMTSSENTKHYQKNVMSKKSSSKHTGVGYHIGIKKWTTRVYFDNKRHSVGTFNTEEEAVEAIKNFNNDKCKLKKGKGLGNLGKRKYTQEEILKTIKLSYEIGVKNTSVLIGMGTTTIASLRREYK